MKKRSYHGFTLIEMLVAISVFILLAASVFSILSAVLQTTSALQDDQNRHDQITALDQLLRHKLSNLPAQSYFLSYRRKGSEGLETNGILFGLSSSLYALDAKLQPNGYYQLRWAELAGQTATSLPSDPVIFAQAAVEQDSPDLSWKLFLSDVKTVNWKFQDSTSLLWVETWNNPAIKPHVAELTVQLAGDLHATTLDLWIPQLAPIMNSPVQKQP